MPKNQHTVSLPHVIGYREIEALEVRCKNFEKGCQWVKELSYLKDHLPKCDYVLVACTNKCKNGNEITQLIRRDLKDHLANNCSRRTIKCPHCQQEGEYEERTGQHLESCECVPVKCSNVGCNDEYPRKYSLEHLKICDYQPVDCKFLRIGCNERPLRKDCKKHEEDDRFHFQITTKEMQKLRDEIDQLKETRSLAPKTFKLELFSEKRRNYGDSIYGRPFYTSSKGYKLCLRIVCSSSHISVFTCLMKGLYDASLTWPFTGTVTIELLNQLEDKNHHKDSVMITAKNNYTSRVVTGERRDGYGIPRFISYDDLDHKPEKNCQYLKDDCLVFRVSVQLPGYKHWLECTD